MSGSEQVFGAMPVKCKKGYDLFLTHAWRFHEDWMQLAGLMDKVPDIAWRNFSLPWHDPAMEPNTEIGGRFIRDSLERQIIPVHCIVFLGGVYEIKSARQWLDLEVALARKHNKPIIGLPAIGKQTVPEEVEALCDAIGEWDVTKLIAAIDDVRALPRYDSASSPA